MTLFNREQRSTSAWILWAALPSFFFISFSQPAALQADPIIFQATTLTSGGCGATLRGDNFYFDATFAYGGCTGRDVYVGIFWPLPGHEGFANPVALGTVDVPGVPDRYAVAYGGGQPTLFKIIDPPPAPDTFSGTVGVNVVLTGTVQVCLEPANVQTPGEVGPCDPQFANFGVININVAGLANFSYYNGYSGARGFEGFVGTSAAAPEPAYLGFAGGGTILLWAIVWQNKRQRTTDMASAKQATR